jgi:Carboxypeptidase regulatory-like domain
VLQRVPLGALLVLLSAGPLSAQATATINGRVVDQGSAVLPGATINITNTATGVARDTITNEQGLYNVPALPPGTYNIKAELPGFAAATRTEMELLAGSTVTVDLTLGVAAVQENVTVAGQVPLIETSTAVVASSIRQTEVRELPMINRSLAAMMTLLPGAREIPASGSHGHAAGYVSFAGNTGRSYNMYVDGVDNKEDQDGGTLVQYSLEGIQEFRALGAGFQAEYGRGSTVVVLATKSGGNRYHGTAFGFGRNESLTATDYFSKPENGGLGKQPFKRMQFGGSVGGPIKRDKMWFFGSAEKIIQDFQLPRPDNVIRELNYLVPIVGIEVGPAVPQPFRDFLAQLKVNYQANSKHSLFVRYGTQRGYVNNPALGNTAALWPDVPFAQQNHQTLWSAAAGWTWVANNTTVNEFRAQYAYYLHDDISSVPCQDSAACVPKRLSFPSVTTAQPFYAHPHWVNYEEKFELLNNFSKQLGRHALKFGADYARLPVFYADLNVTSPGAIAFFDDPSVIVNNTNGRYPRGFQTPGIVRTVTVSSVGPNVRGQSDDAWFAAAYAQDDFKVSSKMTLNLGVRYDINEMSNQCCWDQNRAYQILQAIGHPYGTLPKTDTNNLAPRVGFAYDVAADGKNVVRGSFGMFYATGIITSVYSQDIQAQQTVYFTQQLANSAIGVGALANYVYGVSPLPITAPVEPTNFPAGQSVSANWYKDDFQDARSINTSVGISHLFSGTTVLSADYLHVVTQHGWRSLNINPLVPNPNNPGGPRIRALSLDTLRVFGDPALLGPTAVLCACNRGEYDGVDIHYERRLARTALTVNYTIAYARGMGGTTDFTTQGGAIGPEVVDTLGGDIYAPYEWGPTQVDERHRVTVAGVIPLKWGFDVAPSFTAATARPYTQYLAPSPNGTSNLYIRDANGNPEGPYNARGKALINLNTRVTKNIALPDAQSVSLFAEFYNIGNRANFGNSYFGNAFSPATYNKPNGYLGGIASTTTIPISFQVQFGARYTF